MKPIQINATAEEKGRNNLRVDDITYKDIPLNQTQSEEHRNEELQQHQDIDNRSIIMIENQLTEFPKKQQEKFTKIKKPHVSPKSNENLCCLALRKEEFQKGIDMYDYIKPPLKKMS